MKPPTSHQIKKYQQLLAANEKLIAVFGIGDRYFWSNAISLGIMSFLLIPIPFLLKLIHFRHSNIYILTDKRVIIKRGIFSTEVTTAPYDHITHIIVRQSFLHRLSFKMGDIIIHTAGPTPIEVHLLKVQDPITVKNLIEELISNERNSHFKPKLEEKIPLVKPLD